MRRALISRNSSSRNNFPVSMEDCVLYAPLWQEDTQGSTFYSYDQYRHLNTVVGALWGSQGRSFDGDDTITVPNNAVFQGTGSFSVMGWVKWSAFTQDYAGIIFANQANRWGLQSRTTGFVYFSLYETGVAYHNVTVGTLGTTAWYHIVGLYDDTAKVIRVFLNGTQVGTDTACPGGRPSNTGGLLIGDNGDAPAAGHYFIGTQGELEYCSRTLTAAEVQNNRLATQWRFV